mgnify:CR=1 FL=1
MSAIIDATFNEVAAGLTEPGFGVHAVPVSATAWCHDASIPYHDRAWGWTYPTRTTPDGAIIRYCPEMLESNLPGDDRDESVLIVLNILSGCAIVAMQLEGLEGDELVRRAEDEADDVLGPVVCECDSDDHDHPLSPIDSLALYRMNLTDENP